MWYINRFGSVPPQLLQQHINRSHRRLARMTGREQPSRRTLETAIAKRMYHIEKRGEPLERRFNRHPKAATEATKAAKACVPSL